MGVVSKCGCKTAEQLAPEWCKVDTMSWFNAQNVRCAHALPQSVHDTRNTVSSPRHTHVRTVLCYEFECFAAGTGHPPLHFILLAPKTPHHRTHIHVLLGGAEDVVLWLFG